MIYDKFIKDNTMLTLCFICNKIYDMKNDNDFRTHKQHELNYIIGQTYKKEKNKK